MEEYLACSRGGRRAPVARKDERHHGGAAEICGDVHGGSLTFVRAGDQALAVVALGTPEQAIERYEALLRSGERYWEHEPVAAMFAGTRRFFRPLGGGRALGVIEVEDRALVLGQVEGRLVLVHVHGAVRVLVSTAAIKDLGVVDVDAHMALLPRSRPARGAPPQQVRQQHDRITHGRELAQESSDVICLALQRLGLRATVVVDQTRFGSRHRGKRAVMAFIDLLITLGLMRCGDLCGRTSDIIKQIQRYLPTVEISAAKLGEVLKLLHATGTCLIERPTARTWRIRLAELDDVKGALHQAFCEETPTYLRLLPAADPAAQRHCGFDRSDLAKKPRRPRDAGAASRSRDKVKAKGAAATGPAAAQPAASSEPTAAPAPSGAPPADDTPHRTRSGSPSQLEAASGRAPPAAPGSTGPGLPSTGSAPPSGSSPPPRNGWSALGDRLSQRVASVASLPVTAPMRPDRADITASGLDPPAEPDL